MQYKYRGVHIHKFIPHIYPGICVSRNEVRVGYEVPVSIRDSAWAISLIEKYPRSLLSDLLFSVFVVQILSFDNFRRGCCTLRPKVRGSTRIASVFLQVVHRIFHNYKILNFKSLIIVD
jgi:hypothetical protein